MLWMALSYFIRCYNVLVVYLSAYSVLKHLSVVLPLFFLLQFGRPAVPAVIHGRVVLPRSFLPSRFLFFLFFFTVLRLFCTWGLMVLFFQACSCSFLPW